MQISFMEGFAPSLALIERQKATRKWPIQPLCIYFSYSLMMVQLVLIRITSLFRFSFFVCINYFSHNATARIIRRSNFIVQNKLVQSRRRNTNKTNLVNDFCIWNSHLFNNNTVMFLPGKDHFDQMNTVMVTDYIADDYFLCRVHEHRDRHL